MAHAVSTSPSGRDSPGVDDVPQRRGAGPVGLASLLWWVVLAVAAAGAGAESQNLALPGGWLIGPMVVAVAAGLIRERHPVVDRRVVIAAQAVIGMVLASSFRASALPLIASHWFLILLIVGATLAISMGVGVVLARISGLDQETATLGALPGGASGMIAMSIGLGADTRSVALMQYVRLVLVVLSAALLARFVLASSSVSGHATTGLAVAPASLHGAGLWLTYAGTMVLMLAGLVIATRLHVPAASLLGPLALGVAASLAGVLHPSWPVGVPQASYVLMGIYVGLLFDRASIRAAGMLLPAMVLSTLALTGACALFGWLFAEVTGSGYLTGFLATTPGGMDSITVVGLGSGADISLILAVQMARLFTIVFAGPPIARLVLRRVGAVSRRRGVG